MPAEGAAALRVSPSGRLEDAVVAAADGGGTTLLIALRRKHPRDDSSVQHPAPAETYVVCLSLSSSNALTPNPQRAERRAEERERDRM